MSFNINEYYTDISKGDILLAYKGSITSELINEVLEAVEDKLESGGEEGQTRKKLYNVLVESLQNLYHHIEETHEGINEDLDPKFGILVIEKNKNGDYRVTTGNFLIATKTKLLKEKIDKINSLTRDELKDMYKFILNHQRISAKGGGGLGLVDIARKTGKKMIYNFYPYNEKYVFFDLTIQV
ncbi:hypothetical protein ES705_21280 [subsurface metagenome]